MWLSDVSAYQPEGGGGETTGGRSLQVILFGSIQGASQEPLPPRSVNENSEPTAQFQLKAPQLLTATAPTLRATTFWKVAFPAARALSTDVPVPSTWTSWKWTLVTL